MAFELSFNVIQWLYINVFIFTTYNSSLANQLYLFWIIKELDLIATDLSIIDFIVKVCNTLWQSVIVPVCVELSYTDWMLTHVAICDPFFSPLH